MSGRRHAHAVPDASTRVHTLPRGHRRTSASGPPSARLELWVSRTRTKASDPSCPSLSVSRATQWPSAPMARPSRLSVAPPPSSSLVCVVVSIPTPRAPIRAVGRSLCVHAPHRTSSSRMSKLHRGAMNAVAEPLFRAQSVPTNHPKVFPIFPSSSPCRLRPVLATPFAGARAPMAAC
jgi:hypothetical protein